MASEDAIKGTQNETETQSPDGLFLLSDIFSNCSSCCSFSLKINLQSMFTIKQKELKKSFAREKKCVNTLLNFVSFETRPTWCCYNANVQVCSSISKMYYFRMIILYCYQSYTTYYSIMIRLLVLWLIILHDTLLSKHNKPISLYKANELIFVA